MPERYRAFAALMFMVGGCVGVIAEKLVPGPQSGWTIFAAVGIGSIGLAITILKVRS